MLHAKETDLPMKNTLKDLNFYFSNGYLHFAYSNRDEEYNIAMFELSSGNLYKLIHMNSPFTSFFIGHNSISDYTRSVASVIYLSNILREAQ